MTKVLPERLFDYLSDAILCVDEHLKICQINSTTEELFDLSSSSIIGKNLEHLIRNSDSTIVKSLNYVREERQPITEREVKFIMLSGKEIIADYSIKPIHEIKDMIRYFIEISPITRHIQIAKDEYTLLQTQAAAQLTRGLAHEIKNPLGGIRGAAQLLEREISDPSLKEFTDVIIKETDRLKTLLDNMLGPNKALNKNPVNILEVLEYVINVLTVECEKNIDFKRDYDPSIPEISADKDQLIQAFMNLGKNAVQAIQYSGRVKFQTRIINQHTIGIHKYPSVLQVSISDNGEGIDSEVKNNLFLPMVSNKQEGTGLGLPISQKIIMNHGGIIQCDSRPGLTTFNTLIPLL